MRVNNLLKVITRRKISTAGIWTCDLYTYPETDTLTTQPRRVLFKWANNLISNGRNGYTETNLMFLEHTNYIYIIQSAYLASGFIVGGNVMTLFPTICSYNSSSVSPLNGIPLNDNTHVQKYIPLTAHNTRNNNFI